MAKRVERFKVGISGDSVNAKDNAGFVTTDIQPGDEILVIRRRAGEPDLVLKEKTAGTEMKRTIPAALSTLHDALAVIVSITMRYRTVDTTGWTNAQKAAIFDREEDQTLVNVDENPWA